MSKKTVPVIVIQPHTHSSKPYQVFTATYDYSHHTIKDVSKDYVCFDMMEEVEAYISGLKRGNVIHEQSK